MSPKPTTTRACLWPNDVAPWEVQMPVCPTHGAPAKLTITMMVAGHAYEIVLERKGRSDGAWNFYETSRKRLAPAY